eukprot:3240264-Rhodomonas_salina.1
MTLEVEHEWGLDLWSEESGISMLSDKVYCVRVFWVELAEARVRMSHTVQVCMPISLADLSPTEQRMMRELRCVTCEAWDANGKAWDPTVCRVVGL